MTFKERAKLAMEALEKQEPFTLLQAKEQVKRLKEESVSNTKKGMNISFEEMAKRGKKALEKQEPVTIEQARDQVKRIKEQSKSKNKKHRD